MAERKGFEPLIRFPVYTISSRAPSAKLGHLSSLSEYNFSKDGGCLSMINCISFHFSLQNFYACPCCRQAIDSRIFRQ